MNDDFNNKPFDENEPRTDYSVFQNKPEPEFVEPSPTDDNAVYVYQSPVEEKPKKKISRIIALVLVCAIISTVCGFGGSLLAQKLVKNEVISDGTVIKQSIVNTSNTGADNHSISDIVAACENSVVEITTETVQTNMFMQQYISEGAGSGVIISQSGYIVTNNHVIAGSSSIKVTLKNGTEYSATLIGTDEETDVAVVKIDASNLNSAVLGDSDKIVVGELAIAIGNPLGTLGGTVTDGIISALDREIAIDGETMRLLQTNAAVNPGNSGGGLFNVKGELIGIINAKTSSSGIEGLGFAIPINTASKVATELIDYGYVKGRVSLGVELVEITNMIDAFRYGVGEQGLYISKIYSDSDAYYSGLKAGDRIISANGTEISTEAELKNTLEKLNVGDTLTLKISRGSETSTINIKLTESKG